MDGVCRSETAALESDAREQRIRLDNALDSGGGAACFECDLGLHAVCHERVEAELGQGERGARRLAAGAGIGLALNAGARLEVRGERVAHAGDREAHRRGRDHRRIHEHDIGVSGQEEVAIEDAVFRVDDRERAARRIGGGDGGADHHRDTELVRYSLGGVEHLAAADAHDDIGSGGLGGLRDAVDLGV